MGDPQSIRPLRASLPSIWSVISLWFGGRSRFAGSSQLGALAVLIVTLVATDWCVVQSVRARPLVHGNRIGVDLADGVLYQSVAGRVRRGEGYYSVAAVELGSRGYQARSVFNWRLPAYAWAFGSVGPAVAYAVLAALLALVGVSSTILFEGPSKCLVPLGMLCAYGWLVHPYPPYFPEVWSGLLIFCAEVAVASRHVLLGAIAASLALAFRELAMLYVVVAWAARGGKERMERGNGMDGGSGGLRGVFYLALPLCLSDQSCRY